MPGPNRTGRNVLVVLGGIMGAFLLLVVVAIAAVTLLGKQASTKTGAAASDWQTYRSPSGGFQVDFPGQGSDQPVPESSMPRAVAAAHQAQYVGPDGIYLVVVIQFSPQADLDTVSLEGAARGSVTASGGTVDDLKPATHGADKAVQFTATYTRPSGTGKGIAFLHGDRMVEILVAGKGTVSDDLDRMVASFKLLP